MHTEPKSIVFSAHILRALPAFISVPIWSMGFDTKHMKTWVRYSVHIGSDFCLRKQES